MTTPHAHLFTALDRAGYRLTDPRRAVAELIASRAGHFTAADLLDEAQSRRIPVGRATVFRALELFTSLGALERLDLPGGDHAYVACEPSHHHHIVCSTCGRTAEIDDAGLQAALDEVARSTGYSVQSHRLELYGVCPSCAGRSASGDASARAAS